MAETSDARSLPKQSEGVRVGFARVAEVAANLATVVAAVILSVVLLKVFVFPRPATLASSTTGSDVGQVQKGMNLKSALPGVDWAKNRRTLVMAISTQCHFCTESMPFFQRVTTDSGYHIKTLALLPQTKAEGEAYLSKGGVRVDDVRQVTLNSVGVRGTPTLLLVDGAGTVTNTWYGKLSSDQEGTLLAELKKTS